MPLIFVGPRHVKYGLLILILIISVVVGERLEILQNILSQYYNYVISGRKILNELAILVVLIFLIDILEFLISFHIGRL